MNFFEKITHFLDADMTTPETFGMFHIISAILTLLVTAFLILRFRNASDRTFRKITLFFWVIIVLLEAYKQINFAFDYNGGSPEWAYEWYAFPFQFCSAPMYVLPFIAFMRDGKIRDAFISFMCFFSILGGIAVMVYPGNVFIETIGINVQTMFHHGSQVALGIYFAVYSRKKISKGFFKSAIPILFVLISIAFVLNIGVYRWMLSNGIDEEFNMFYISPYFTAPLPIFSDISESAPYPVYLILYIVALLLGGLLVFGICKLTQATGRKIKALCKDKVITLPAVLFFIIEAALGVMIQLTSGDTERILCFSSVALAALFALLAARKNKCSALTVLGLIFTVCADVFLVLLTEGDKLVAMYFFSIVQLLYFVRVLIENKNGKTRRKHVVFRIEALFTAFIVTLAVLGDSADALSIISVLYFANLLVNIVFSFINFKRAPIFAIGLLLFAFCDILVGFSMLDLYISVSETSIIYRLTHTEINLIWAFYVPSQTLIALSTKSTPK